MNATKTRTADIATALTDVRAEIHELLARVAAKTDAVNPDTANWGHVGDLNLVAQRLREALGLE